MNDRLAKSLAARRSYLEKKEKGFTLVELLVVVLIIGILAAIAIPMFLSQRQSAWEAQVRSDLANAVIAAETYAVGRNGSYAGLGAAELTANGYTATNGVAIVPTPSAAAAAVGSVLAVPAGVTYTLVATNTSMLGTTWTYTSTTSRTVRAPALP